MTMQCSPATAARSSAAAARARPGFRGPRPSPEAAARADAYSPPPPCPKPNNESVEPHSPAAPAKARNPTRRPAGGRERKAASPPAKDGAWSPGAERESRQIGNDHHPRRLQRRTAHQNPGAERLAARIRLRNRCFGGGLGLLKRRNSPGFAGVRRNPGGGEPLQFGLEGRVPAQQIGGEEHRGCRNGETDQVEHCPARPRRVDEFHAPGSSPVPGTPGRTRTVRDSPRITFPGGPPFTLRTFFLLV